MAPSRPGQDPNQPVGSGVATQRGGEGERDATARAREESETLDGWRSGSAAATELDPMARSLMWPIPRGAFVQAPPPAAGHDLAAQAQRVSLEHLFSRFVRRVAWSGDGHAGSARIEFGAGALAGATLTLHAHGGDLQVSLDLPPGVDGAMWKERIGQRLSARGLQVSSLEVG
jgi:hypothetical protein